MLTRTFPAGAATGQTTVDSLMSQGTRAYQFPVTWSGDLDVASRLVDTLLANGITPWATMCQGNLPRRLEELGGWTNRDTASRSAEFTESVACRLGDRVTNWTTLNSPWSDSFMSYPAGDAVTAAHHLLLAHGLGLSVIRSLVRKPHTGIALDLYPVRAQDPTDSVDVDAARRIDGLQNRIFLDPVTRGAYPWDVLADLAAYGLFDLAQPGDLEVISAPIDFLGVNYHHDHVVSGHGEPRFPSPWVGSEHVTFLPSTDSGLAELLVDLDLSQPGLPLYVSKLR